MKRWTLHKLDRGLGPFGAEWDALHARLFRPNPMLDSRFLDALLQYFGVGTEYLAVFRSGGTARAMCIITRARFALWKTFLPAQAQIGPALIDDADLVPRLVSALPGIRAELDLLCNDSDFGDLGADASRQDEISNHALTISIRLVGGFDSYWAGRSRKLQQNIARYQRRCASDDLTPRFVRVDDPGQLAAAVARYGELESSGWKGRLGTAVTMDTTQGLFYTDIARRFGATGEACVYELWLGDRLAASRITVCSGTTMVMLKTTYDESMNQYAPGRLLLHKTIEHAFASWPGGVIEFYTNANSDLLAWATDQRWIRHISFYDGVATAKLITAARACRNILTRLGPRGSGTDCTVDVHHHPNEFPADTRRLFDDAEKAEVELGAPWFGNLVNTVFPEPGKVDIYVLRRAGRPIAALPMLAGAEAQRGQVRSLSNYYTAIYAPIVAPRATASELALLVAAVRLKGRRPASLRFAPMDPQTDKFLLLEQALRLAGYATFRFYCFGNWFLKAAHNWQEYLKARDGMLRSTIKRAGKKFAAAGGRLEIIQKGADLERGLAAYQQVYAASWKVPEPFPEFIPGLARTCSERGWLRLGVAWMNDAPIAAQLWIVTNGKASIYKLAYHDGFKAYAPGTLLTALQMQKAIEDDKVTEIDYLIGDDVYKQSWMNQRRERWGLVAFNTRSLPGIIGLSLELAGRIAKSIRRRFWPIASPGLTSKATQ